MSDQSNLWERAATAVEAVWAECYSEFDTKQEQVVTIIKHACDEQSEPLLEALEAIRDGRGSDGLGDASRLYHAQQVARVVLACYRAGLLPTRKVKS